LGAMLTDQVWFWTATRGSAWLMDVYCRLTRRARGCIDDSVAGLARYGPPSVILGRFFTVVRVVTWPMLLQYRSGSPCLRAPDACVAGLARYGPLSVILGRFFTVVRVVTWPMLVRNGLGWPRFAALDAVGAVVWSAIWVGLGWIVGDQWQDAAQSASGWLLIGGAVFVVGLAGPLALRAWRRRARERSAH